MAATSASASGLAASASIMPTWSKSQATEPEVPSWPLRNSTRISGAVRFTLSVRHSTITGTRCGAKPSYITCSKCTASSPMPAPFLMARSSVSLGMETLRACSTTRRRRELSAGSAPLRAATMISLASLPNSLPLASAAWALPFAFHCAPISASLCDLLNLTFSVQAGASFWHVAGSACSGHLGDGFAESRQREAEQHAADQQQGQQGAPDHVEPGAAEENGLAQFGVVRGG